MLDLSDHYGSSAPIVMHVRWFCLRSLGTTMNEKELPRTVKYDACFRSLSESELIPIGDGTLVVCRKFYPQARLLILTPK